MAQHSHNGREPIMQTCLSRTLRPRGKCVWGRAGRLIAWVVVAIASTTATASAQTYSMSWDPNTDPYTVGYRVFGGTVSGQYGWSLDVGNASAATLPDLPRGSAYYFVVRAYNAAGEMGLPSNEVSINLGGPPGVPRSVGASVSGSTVTLSWQSPVGGNAPSTYLISVGSAPGASDIASGLSVGNLLSVSGNLPQYRYYARVQAANAYGIGPASADVTFAVGGTDQPGNPSGLAASWNGTVATLTWNPGTGATSYYLEAGSVSGAADLARINVGAATRYVIDVPPGRYFVRVRAASASSVSGPSNEIVVQGPGGPEPPTSLSATGSNGVVDLRWFAPTTGSQPTGYILEAGSAPGQANLATAQVGLQTRLVTTAPPGVYYVRIRAVNARGVSRPSNEIIVRR